MPSELEHTLKRETDSPQPLPLRVPTGQLGRQTTQKYNMQREGNSITLAFKKIPLNCPFYMPIVLPT